MLYIQIFKSSCQLLNWTIIEVLAFYIDQQIFTMARMVRLELRTLSLLQGFCPDPWPHRDRWHLLCMIHDTHLPSAPNSKLHPYQEGVSSTPQFHPHPVPCKQSPFGLRIHTPGWLSERASHQHRLWTGKGEYELEFGILGRGDYSQRTARARPPKAWGPRQGPLMPDTK